MLEVILFTQYETYTLVSGHWTVFKVRPQHAECVLESLLPAEIQVYASSLPPIFYLCFEPLKGHFQSKLHF